MCKSHLRLIAGFCKQQLWPLFHYLLPLSPNSMGRFNPELWQAYVKANKVIVSLVCFQCSRQYMYCTSQD